MVRRYMPTEPKHPGMTAQRWMTFVRNHAKAIVAGDFFIVVTATFRLVYVFVIMEVSRRILHFNTTRPPTAEWTLQQFRECVTGEIRTSSSFMTATASIPENWIRRFDRWV